jgi:hypothetical protein
VELGACRRELGEPALDRGVDVLIAFVELERSGLQLVADDGETLLDGAEVGRRDEPGGFQSARVGNAAGDVIRIELEVGLQ